MCHGSTRLTMTLVILSLSNDGKGVRSDIAEAWDYKGLIVLNYNLKRCYLT